MLIDATKNVGQSTKKVIRHGDNVYLYILNLNKESPFLCYNFCESCITSSVTMALHKYLQLELRAPPVTWATRRFKLRTHAVPTQKLLLRTEVQESRSMSFENS